MSGETSGNPKARSSRLASLLKILGKSTQLSASSENRNENQSTIEQRQSDETSSGCKCRTKGERNITSDESNEKNYDNAKEYLVEEDNKCNFLFDKTAFDKYMLEEYIEKDGKYFKTSSLEEAAEESHPKMHCIGDDNVLSSPKKSRRAGDLVNEEDDDTIEDKDDDDLVDDDSVDDNTNENSDAQDKGKLSEKGSLNEEIVTVESSCNYSFDNSLRVVENLLFGPSRVNRTDEDRNDIYDRWMRDLEVWERNRLIWLDEISCLEGFDPSDNEDRTFLVKTKKPVLSDVTRNKKSLSAAKFISVSAQKVRSMKTEASNSLNVKPESEQLSPKDKEKWYQSERLRIQKELYEKGLPNWYEDLLQEQSNNDVEVLSVASVDLDSSHTSDTNSEIVSVEKAQPKHCNFSVDVVLVYQFTDRHLWRKYHGCWKTGKLEH